MLLSQPSQQIPGMTLIAFDWVVCPSLNQSLAGGLNYLIEQALVRYI